MLSVYYSASTMNTRSQFEQRLPKFSSDSGVGTAELRWRTALRIDCDSIKRSLDPTQIRKVRFPRICKTPSFLRRGKHDRVDAFSDLDNLGSHPSSRNTNTANRIAETSQTLAVIHYVGGRKGQSFTKLEVDGRVSPLERRRCWKSLKYGFPKKNPRNKRALWHALQDSALFENPAPWMVKGQR